MRSSFPLFAVAAFTLFAADVYSNNAKCSRGDIHVRTSEVGDGYAWYYVATWVPAPDELFWRRQGTAVYGFCDRGHSV